MDAQEPQDGARDDETIGGIVRHETTRHGSILVTWTCTWTQVGIALKCHNSPQSSPFESKLGCPRASGRCPRRWDHPPAQTHKAGGRRARYMRRTSHRTHPDTSVNRPYLTLTEADSDALWSSVTTGPRRSAMPAGEAGSGNLFSERELGGVAMDRVCGTPSRPRSTRPRPPSSSRGRHSFSPRAWRLRSTQAHT